MRFSDAIKNEASKLIRRHQRYATDLEDALRRVEKRSNIKPLKNLQLPSYWTAADGFNPYHVRSRAEKIGDSIANALRKQEYHPRPAVFFEVPKEGGDTRKISVFQVADSALSRLVFKQLMQKNASRLSSHCYAYRTDITLHDAVLNISADLRGRTRLFVAEYDFSKFFDSISQEHIERIITDQRFFITDEEMRIIRAFLATPTLDESQYTQQTKNCRTKGIPQGTSISLFLANIAAYPLDQSLERLGVGFARFADDTIIWSDNYGLVCDATVALEKAARNMGTSINLKKSSGISILAASGAPAEFNAKASVDFLGYNISSTNISIKSKAVVRIKRWIAYLIYSNLLKAPLHGICVGSRVAPSVDRDYVVLVYQLRRYLYGNLSEIQLQRYLARATTKMRYRGLMSFYPIVDNEESLRELDGWLLHTIFTTLRRRAALFATHGFGSLPHPHGLDKEDLLALQAFNSNGDSLDLRLPSFARIGKLLRRASRAFGANGIAHPLSQYSASGRRDLYNRVT